MNFWWNSSCPNDLMTLKRNTRIGTKESFRKHSGQKSSPTNNHLLLSHTSPTTQRTSEHFACRTITFQQYIHVFKNILWFWDNFLMYILMESIDCIMNFHIKVLLGQFQYSSQRLAKNNRKGKAQSHLWVSCR